MDKSARKLAYTASLTHLVAYVLYNSAVLSGDTRPNLVPWAIWGVMAVLNALTYRAQTGDKVKALLSLTGSIAAVATFVVAAWMGGKFQALTGFDQAILLAGIVAVGIWKLGSAKYANLCVLTAVAIGFIPFYRDPSGEQVLPWLLWSLAFFTGVVVVGLRPEGRKNADFIQPVIFALLHVGVLLLIVF